MSQSEIDVAMLKQTILWGLNSKAQRFKVGAMIVKNQQIISDGFNGTPAGFDNVCEELVEVFENGRTANGCKPTQTLKTKDIVLHAESNAISKLAKHGGVGSYGATIYITLGPCVSCAKLIIQAGIKRVVFATQYRDDAGLRLLGEAGIEIVEIPEMENFYKTQLYYHINGTDDVV